MPDGDGGVLRLPNSARTMPARARFRDCATTISPHHTCEQIRANYVDREAWKVLHQQSPDLDRCLEPHIPFTRTAIRAHAIQNTKTLDRLTSPGSRIQFRARVAANGPRATLICWAHAYRDIVGGQAGDAASEWAGEPRSEARRTQGHRQRGQVSGDGRLTSLSFAFHKRGEDSNHADECHLPIGPGRRTRTITARQRLDTVHRSFGPGTRICAPRLGAGSEGGFLSVETRAALRSPRSIRRNPVNSIRRSRRHPGGMLPVPRRLAPHLAEVAGSSSRSRRCLLRQRLPTPSAGFPTRIFRRAACPAGPARYQFVRLATPGSARGPTATAFSGATSRRGPQRYPLHTFDVIQARPLTRREPTTLMCVPIGSGRIGSVDAVSGSGATKDATTSAVRDPNRNLSDGQYRRGLAVAVGRWSSPSARPSVSCAQSLIASASEPIYPAPAAASSPRRFLY